MVLHDLRVEYSDLEIGKEIGKGNFSRVYRGEYFGDAVAIKKISQNTEIEKYLKNEVALLKDLSHPNLVQFIGATEYQKFYFIITEFLPAGDLKSLLANKSQSLGWKLRLQIAKGIIDGIGYLHSNDIIHRDIKTENVLMDHNRQWTAKVCDFGFARKAQNLVAGSRMTICGTGAYMAPELLFEEDYGSKADIFSYGVVLAAILTRINPEPEPKRGDFLWRSPATKFQIDEAEIEGKAEEGYPSMFLDLVKRCCAYEASDRPNASEAQEMLQNMLDFQDEDTDPMPTFKAEAVKKKTSIIINNNLPSPTSLRILREDKEDSDATSPGETSPIDSTTFSSLGDRGAVEMKKREMRKQESTIPMDVLQEVNPVLAATLMHENVSTFVNMSGYLYQKKVTGFRNWRKAWFTLDNGILYISKAQDAAKTIEINLQNCSAIITPGLLMNKRFQIRNTESRIFDFCASEHNEMLDWIDAINISSRYKTCVVCNINYLPMNTTSETCSKACTDFQATISSKGFSLAKENGKAILVAKKPVPPLPESKSNNNITRTTPPPTPPKGSPSSGPKLSPRTSPVSFSPLTPTSRPLTPTNQSSEGVFGSMIKRFSSKNSNLEDKPEDIITFWLTGISLQHLAPTFIKKGYVNVEMIRKAGGLDESDLDFIGVDNPLHRRLLLSESKKI